MSTTDVGGRENSVGHYPTGSKWAFDEGVTACFEDMLERSVPGYREMRESVFEVGREFVKKEKGTDVVDLGCSRGEALAPFVEEFGAYNRYVGVESSEPMRAAAAKRFAGFISCNAMQILALDLRAKYPPVRASLTLSVLTLCFTPIEHRQRILLRACKSTVPGGAMVVVEKVLGSGGEVDELLVDRYRASKERAGYSRDEIDRKAMSLEGVQVPVTARWNEELLRGAGFADVECFWRRWNFAAWVAVKR